MFKITTDGIFSFINNHYGKISLAMIGGCALFTGYFYRTVYRAQSRKRLLN